MMLIIEPQTILDIIGDNVDTPTWTNDNDQTNPWVAVSENIIRNHEMLYAFHDPIAYKLPKIRVGRILDNNDFIVCGPGFDKDVNLGNYTKLGQMYYKHLPKLPDSMETNYYYS